MFGRAGILWQSCDAIGVKALPVDTSHFILRGHVWSDKSATVSVLICSTSITKYAYREKEWIWALFQSNRREWFLLPSRAYVCGNAGMWWEGCNDIGVKLLHVQVNLLRKSVRECRRGWQSGTAKITTNIIYVYALIIINVRLWIRFWSSYCNGPWIEER